ncbi:MAG TPA: ribose-phosphate diphosphokinase, partial [Dehalococcoidia bacterium]
ELTALYTITRYFQERELDNLVVVATDVGDSKRARNVAERLDVPLAIIEKRRIGNVDRAEALNVIGEVQGRRALIVDDEIDTAGTVMQAIKVLQERGVTEIYAACTHPLLTGPAVERLSGSPIKELVVTDTIPLGEKQIPQVTVLSVAPLIGEAIRRIHTGQSVGALFQ